jgi:hypothetical protein
VNLQSNVQRPASSGESRSTSWRYWAAKKKVPAITKMLSRNAESEVPNAGSRKIRTAYRLAVFENASASVVYA